VLGRIGPNARTSKTRNSRASLIAAKQTVGRVSNEAEGGFPSTKLAGQFLAVSFVAGALGIIHFYAPLPVPLKVSLQSFPVRIGEFSGKDLVRIDERLRPYPADEEIMRVYENGDGKRAEVYIGYFETQSRERKILGYHHEWMYQGVKRVQVGAGEGRVYINKTQLKSHDSTSSIYFWYDIDGSITTNRFLGKLRIFFFSLFSRKANAAVVVVNSRSSDVDLAPLLEKLVPLVKTYLSTA
jgi:EpsI family protein